MTILPGVLVFTKEELDSVYTKLGTDVVMFNHHTGQEHFALHLDVILPGYASSRGVPITYSIKDTLTTLADRYAGAKFRLNVHLMGDRNECLEVLALCTKHNEFFGEVYVPHFMYPELTSFAHVNWIVGEWYEKGFWNQTTEFASREVLLMTVQSGRKGQQADMLRKFQALTVARNSPGIEFVFDGGWKRREVVTDANIELVINTDFWESI